MSPNDPQATAHATTVAVLSLAIQVVSQRILVILAMLITAGMFGYALWAHEWIALVTAASFAVLVFLPILWRSGANANQAN